MKSKLLTVMFLLSTIMGAQTAFAQSVVCVPYNELSAIEVTVQVQSISEMHLMFDKFGAILDSNTNLTSVSYQQSVKNDSIEILWTLESSTIKGPALKKQLANALMVQKIKGQTSDPSVGHICL